MVKPRKETRYHYRRDTMTAKDFNEQQSKLGRPDLELESTWKDRMRAYGVTEEQLDAFVEVRSLEAFIDYCREQDIELADIAGGRLESNRA